MNEVLIVGAGPTGLATACLLRQLNVQVRIVDRSPAPAKLAKAMVLWSRSLEVLDELGIAGAALAAGEPLKCATYSEESHLLATVRTDRVPGTRWQPLILPQHELERLLRDRLEALEVKVQWGTEVSAVAQEPQHVTATLRAAAGFEQSVSAFAVGCDGLRSVVREGAKISWTAGSPYEEVFELGEVDADSPLARGAAHHYLGKEGVAVSIPVPGASWRVAGYLDGRSERKRPDRSSLQDLLDSCGGGMTTINQVNWSAQFAVVRRLAERFRSGRLLIAGDAAHVHSPAGGQGLNTGLQDAHNLAWKLALVVKGLARETLLDTYNAERRPVAAHILKMTELQDKRLFGARSATARGVRNAVLRVLGGSGLMEILLVPDLAQLRVHYARSPLTAGDSARASRYRPGRRLPDVDVVPAGETQRIGLRHACAGAGITLILVPGVHDAQNATPHEVLERYKGAVRCFRLRSPLPDRTGASGSSYLLGVRPDGYVGYRGPDRETTGLSRWLGQALALTQTDPVTRQDRGVKVMAAAI